MNPSETWDDFEKDALLVKDTTQKLSNDVFQLLKESMGLLANAFSIAVSPNNEDSTLAKMSLLSHNFNTLKCSVDLALRGYYVQSQNILRVIYENWVSFHYISQVPEEAKLWLIHNPSEKVPTHSKMLTKLGSDFSPVIKRMKEWYSTLCSFAHTDPINLVSHISQDMNSNETSIHFGTTFNQDLFKISAYTLAMWIGIMLSTIKMFVPEKNHWHEQEGEFQEKLLRYIDEQNKAYKKK